MTKQNEVVRWIDRAAGLVILLFLVATSLRPSSPGLYYDEVLFVPAALGAPVNQFIHIRLFGVPIMLMSYIGALKAWLYAPIFAIFGVSPATIRLPAVALTAGTLWVGYRTIRRLISPACGLLFTVLCAVSPALFTICRNDWGPASIMLFAKALCLYLVVKQRDSLHPKYLLLSFVVFALGVFDKLNFVWYLVPHLACILIFTRRETFQRFLTNRRFLWGAGLFFGGLAVAGAFLILPLIQLPKFADLAHRVFQMAHVFAITFDGRATADLFWGDMLGITKGPWCFFVYVAIAGALVASWVAWSKSRREQPSGKAAAIILFAVTSLIVIFAEITITPQAGGPHHFIMLFPYPQMILAGMVFSVWPSGLLEKRSPLQFACISLFAFLAFTFAWFDAAASFRHLSANLSRTKTTAHWSPAISTLAQTLLKTDVDRIVVADWGIANQLYCYFGKQAWALSKDRQTRKRKKKWRDLICDGYMLFQSEERTNDPKDALHAMESPKVLIVSFTPENATFPEIPKAISRVMAADGRPYKQTTISDFNGAPLYEIRWIGCDPK